VWRHPIERNDATVLDRERTDLLAVGRQHDRLPVRLVVEELREVLRQIFVDRGDRQVQGGRAKRRSVDQQEEEDAEHRHHTQSAATSLPLVRSRRVGHGMLSL
jgi:hypothetical protein